MEEMVASYEIRSRHLTYAERGYADAQRRFEAQGLCVADIGKHEHYAKIEGIVLHLMHTHPVLANEIKRKNIKGKHPKI